MLDPIARHFYSFKLQYCREWRVWRDEAKAWRCTLVTLRTPANEMCDVRVIGYGATATAAVDDARRQIPAAESDAIARHRARRTEWAVRSAWEAEQRKPKHRRSVPDA